MAGRYALIVATDAYADPKLSRLRAPARDAAALAEVLGDPEIGEFEVELAHQRARRGLRRRIAAFFSDRRREELLLLHFSCHGLKDDSGQLYFAAADTEVAYLDATAIPAEFVSRQMARSRSNNVLMLLDCCYSGAIARGLTLPRRRPRRRQRPPRRQRPRDHHRLQRDGVRLRGRRADRRGPPVRVHQRRREGAGDRRGRPRPGPAGSPCASSTTTSATRSARSRPTSARTCSATSRASSTSPAAAGSPRPRCPRELLDALANQFASVREGAVAALAELLAGRDRALRRGRPPPARRRSPPATTAAASPPPASAALAASPAARPTESPPARRPSRRPRRGPARHAPPKPPPPLRASTPTPPAAPPPRRDTPAKPLAAYRTSRLAAAPPRRPAKAAARAAPRRRPRQIVCRRASAPARPACLGRLVGRRAAARGRVPTALGLQRVRLATASTNDTYRARPRSPRSSS